MRERTGQEEIEDGQVVMRRVRKSQTTTDTNDGPQRPTSDAFIQNGPDGETSVYLASETTPERITKEYPDVYVAEVEVRAIRAQGLDVERDPIVGDQGHCNIVGRKTRGKAVAIARSARWMQGYGPEKSEERK
jgi:hypothetical protein